MKHKFSPILSAIQHPQIVITIVAVFLLLGVYALLNMPRQEMPKFTIRTGLIIAVYPGATSQQVEEQVTTKVENYLFGFDEVDKAKTYSTSRDGMMIIYVEVAPHVKNPDEFWSKLRHGLNELKVTFPQEVLALIADNDFGDTAALILAVEADQATYKQMDTYLKQLKNELRKLPAASKIKVHGLQNEQVSIYIDEDKLANYGIKPLTVLAMLKTEGSVNYSGDLDNGTRVLPVRVPARYQTESDLAQQIVYTDPLGRIVRLKDVARIVREYPDPDYYIKVNGKKSVIVSLEMLHGYNIVDFGKDVDKISGNLQRQLPPGVKIEKISDLPDLVHSKVNEFLKEFLITILAVILVTMLLLPRKVATIAGLTIPLTVFISLFFLYRFGFELQTVTLASLILVLGMVVDNAIVIIDNHVEKLDQGMTPINAAWKSAHELALPVGTATLAIIAAFFPMPFLLKGIAKDFLWSLPITVTITLVLSYLISIFFVPYLNKRFITIGLSTPEKNMGKPSLLERMQYGYDKSLDTAFTHRKRVYFITIATLICALIIMLIIPQQMFPILERNQFAVEIYLPNGASLAQTSIVATDVTMTLRKDHRVKNVATFYGMSSPRFHTVYAPNLPAKNYAQLIVNTVKDKDTDDMLYEYEKNFQNRYPEAHIRWKQLVMQNVTTLIEVRLSGDSISALKQAADQVMKVYRTDPNVTWVRSDFEDPLEAISLDLNRDEANRLGFTKSLIGYGVAMGLKGIPLSTLWEGDYPISVVLKRDIPKPENMQSVSNQAITSPFLFSSTKVRQIATLKPDWSEGQIVRRNGVRTITVRVDVAKRVIDSKIFNKHRAEIEALKLPEGIKLSYGGERESGLEQYPPLIYSLLISIILIFFMLLFQFKRIKLAVLILITMPLGIFGALFGLLVTNFPFGVVAFAGIISLCGMAVRNGVILVDYAEWLRREKGLSVTEAAQAAGKRRMRPIFLTSVAAAVGVTPMIIFRSLLWGPLASVIFFGLLFSMILTLYVLPLLYVSLNKNVTAVTEGSEPCAE